MNSDDFISQRVRETQEAIDFANFTVGVQDGNIFNPLYNNEHFKPGMIIPVTALEMFMVLMTSDFAVWFFRQVLTHAFLSQHVAWGPDFMWCLAAYDYAGTYSLSTSEKMTQIGRAHV